jgi:hypothetical protein
VFSDRLRNISSSSSTTISRLAICFALCLTCVNSRQGGGRIFVKSGRHGWGRNSERIFVRKRRKTLEER